MTSKLLTKADIEAILLRVGLNDLLDELIERLRLGFQRLDPKNPLIPARTGIHYKNPDLGLLEWMPAATNEGKASLKIVGYHPTNPSKRQLPTILSTISVFDTNSGHLVGLLDGTFATALRTGALSAVATNALGNPASGGTLGIVGTGAQAVTQCHAISRVFPISKIIAYDRNPQALSSFAKRVSFLNIPIETRTSEDLPTLLESADVLCTCTSEEPGKGPLFEDFNNRPGLHINAIGSDFPNKFELPIALLKRSFVCPDFPEQALAEGECQQLKPDEIGADLSQILLSPSIALEQRENLTVFDSTGHAYADYLTSLLFLDYAGSLGLGTDVELECIPQDPRDPYSFLSGAILAEIASQKTTHP